MEWELKKNNIIIPSKEVNVSTKSCAKKKKNYLYNLFDITYLLIKWIT